MKHEKITQTNNTFDRNMPIFDPCLREQRSAWDAKSIQIGFTRVRTELEGVLFKIPDRELTGW